MKASSCCIPEQIRKLLNYNNIICDAITNLTDGHVSDDESQISMVER